MRLFILFAFLTTFSQAAWAQRFEPIMQPIGGAEKIVVVGFKGVLQIVPTESETLKVEARKTGQGDLSGWTFEVKPRLNEIEVRVKAPVEQEGWEKVRSGKDLAEFEMKITTPQRPLEIFWNEGQVFGEQWKSDLSLQMTKGKVKFTKGEGNLRLQLVEGRLEVSEQQGNLALQTFKGQTILSKNKGSLIVNNHSARYSVSEQEGPVEFRNHSGTSTLSKLKGSAVVKNVSGVISLKGFEGSFEGDFSKGALNAKVGEIQSFNVTSDEAAVTLDVPKESGANVHLRSEKGRLWAPIHLGKTKKGRWTERRGRLKGKQQGNIKIVSKYGDIVLK